MLIKTPEMEKDASLNRAGNKGSENYIRNADDVSELVPFSGRTFNHTDEITENEITETDSPSDLLQSSLRPNDSHPILFVTGPSTPGSRSPSPQDDNHLCSNLEENKIEPGRLDNVSVALSEYQFSDSQERSSVSFNSTLPKGNASEAGTEMSDRTKSTTPLSSIADAKDEDEQVLEVLRMVVRKCTNLEPNKRPSSEEVQSLLISSLK